MAEEYDITMFILRCQQRADLRCKSTQSVTDSVEEFYEVEDVFDVV